MWHWRYVGLRAAGTLASVVGLENDDLGVNGERALSSKVEDISKPRVRALPYESMISNRIRRLRQIY